MLTRQPAVQEQTRPVVQEHATSKFSLLLSPSGQEFIRENPGVFRLFRKYRNDFEQRRSQQGKVRQKMVEGNEGVIYTMGDELPIVVKEYHVPFVTTYPNTSVKRQAAFLQDTLVRGENLRQFCEEYAPEFVRVPRHYGFLYLPLQGTQNVRECLLFMERVNGVSLEAFAAGASEQMGISAKVRRQVIEDWQTEIAGLWDVSQMGPHGAEQPLVTDLFPKNALVDFSSPNQQRPYTLWIIDQ